MLKNTWYIPVQIMLLKLPKRSEAKTLNVGLQDKKKTLEYNVHTTL